MNETLEAKARLLDMRDNEEPRPAYLSTPAYAPQNAYGGQQGVEHAVCMADDLDSDVEGTEGTDTGCDDDYDPDWDDPPST